MKLMNRKGQVQMLQGFIYAIVGIGVILAMGLLLLTALSDASRVGGVSTGATTVASNATDSIVTKLATAPTYIGLLIVMVFIVVILGFFAVRGSGGAY